MTAKVRDSQSLIKKLATLILEKLVGKGNQFELNFSRLKTLQICNKGLYCPAQRNHFSQASQLFSV